VWKVDVNKISKNGWNLDIKNPNNKKEEVVFSTDQVIARLTSSFQESEKILAKLKKHLK